jgi:hypothetical protein
MIRKFGRPRILWVLAYLCISSGCATAPSYQELKLQRAQTFAKTQNYAQAFDTLVEDLVGYGTPSEKSRSIVNSDPAFQAQIPDLVRREAAKATSLSQMNPLRNIASFSGKDAVIPAASTRQGLLSDLDQAVGEANRTGRIPVVLIDDIKNYPSLITLEADRIIFERSVAALRQGGQLKPLIAAVFDRATKGGPKSVEYALVERSLPELVLSTDDLKSYVAPTFPQYVSKLLAERTVTVRLISEPEDRLLEEDLSTKIKRLSANIVLTRDEDPMITLTVKRLQWDERLAPARAQTVIYSTDQVNFVSAVLLMPRNASYIYEVTSSGIELAYAYEVKAQGKGQPPFNKLIREKASRQWHSCSNARIQNVFGGVQPASFVANPHMQQTCSGGGSPVSVEQLRDDALDVVVRAVGEVPAVSKAVSYR